MPAPCSLIGLGLASPLVLNVLTAPAERVKLFLQTQDEIILNIREESLAHHHHTSSIPHAPHPEVSTSTSPTISEPKQSKERSNMNKVDALDDDDNDDEDEEPRSIIVPYAHLPYTDMPDCFCRLVEKEGRRSLWRGYSLECVRFILQAGIERGLYRHRIMDVRGWLSITTQSLGGAGWILGAAIEGTMTGTVALLVVYPLAALQTKMATDVIRKTRKVKKTIVVRSMDAELSPYEAGSNGSTSTSTSGSIIFTPVEMEPSPSDSVEWIEPTENHSPFLESKKDPVKTIAPTSQEYEYALSYKYQDGRDALQSALASAEGYWGLYKGFSTVVLSNFVSRLGTLTLYRLIAPTLLRWSQSSSSSLRGGIVGLGTFLVVFGATSVVNLIVYPLSTICHRRMIAAPGRYSSSWDAGKQIVENHGWKALYKGVEVAMLKSAVVAVLSQIF